MKHLHYAAAFVLAGAMMFASDAAFAQQATPAPQKTPITDHHHPDIKKEDFGTTTIAGVRFESITQEGPIIPGTEGAFDLVIAERQTPPKALRAWIGVESARGSVKTPAEKEPNRHYHSHMTVPDPLPPGSMYWLEVEPAEGKIARAGFKFFIE